jgi:cytochrome P450
MAAADEPIALDSTYFNNPHDAEAGFRVTTPVQPVIAPNGVRGMLVTRYDDVKALLANPRIRKDSRRATELLKRQLPSTAPSLHPAFRRQAAVMLNTDPPDHTRLRKLVNKVFTARAVARLRPRIVQIVNDLLDDMDRATMPIDLLEAFAVPLSMTVICELLGVPGVDQSKFVTWTRMVQAVEAGSPLGQTATEFNEYLVELIEHKRRNPTEDLLSDLITVSADGSRLSPDELLSMVVMLLVAGNDTTANLIANGMLSLLRTPDQLAALRAEPELLTNTIEELLRHDGSVHIGTFRFTTEEIELNGAVIPADEFVMLSLSSANRDEIRFDEPDDLDIMRRASGHIAFGHGIHYCVGAPLARLEAGIAIEQIVSRFPALRLAVDPEALTWRTSLVIRGLTALPVYVRS